ncbi:hypothetical protein K438DRAFT_1941620 [Mycena galopus ATCC 62051]|nr:hypothetical protein K438DRAFT_1941620 [Mycena galopus ATCC 62051]
MAIEFSLCNSACPDEFASRTTEILNQPAEEIGDNHAQLRKCNIIIHWEPVWSSGNSTDCWAIGFQTRWLAAPVSAISQCRTVPIGRMTAPRVLLKLASEPPQLHLQIGRFDVAVFLRQFFGKEFVPIWEMLGCMDQTGFAVLETMLAAATIQAVAVHPCTTFRTFALAGFREDEGSESVSGRRCLGETEKRTDLLTPTKLQSKFRPGLLDLKTWSARPHLGQL